MSSNKEKEFDIEYTSNSDILNFKKMIYSMIHDLKISIELGWRIFVRNINAKYRQTYFGYIWALFPPIVTTMLFVFLKSQQIFNVKETVVPYAVYVLTGMVLWHVFVDAVNSPLKIANQSTSLLTKINFPREALILAGIGEVLFDFSIRFILLIAVFFWFKIPMQINILLFPAAFISLLSLGLMIGLLLLPVGLLYKDIEKGMAFILTGLFILTPVIYPEPTTWPASATTIFNPVATLLITARETLLVGELTHFSSYCYISFFTAVFLFISWFIYRLSMPHIIERLHT